MGTEDGSAKIMGIFLKPYFETCQYCDGVLEDTYIIPAGEQGGEIEYVSHKAAFEGDVMTAVCHTLSNSKKGQAAESSFCRTYVSTPICSKGELLVIN